MIFQNAKYFRLAGPGAACVLLIQAAYAYGQVTKTRKAPKPEEERCSQ